jgi:hypothetical protein
MLGGPTGDGVSVGMPVTAGETGPPRSGTSGSVPAVEAHEGTAVVALPEMNPPIRANLLRLCSTPKGEGHLGGYLGPDPVASTPSHQVNGSGHISVRTGVPVAMSATHSS